MPVLCLAWASAGARPMPGVASGSEPWPRRLAEGAPPLACLVDSKPTCLGAAVIWELGLGLGALLQGRGHGNVHEKLSCRVGTGLPWAGGRRGEAHWAAGGSWRPPAGPPAPPVPAGPVAPNHGSMQLPGSECFSDGRRAAVGHGGRDGGSGLPLRWQGLPSHSRALEWTLEAPAQAPPRLPAACMRPCGPGASALRAGTLRG